MTHGIRCPYCGSDLSQYSTTCKFCGRELSIFERTPRKLKFSNLRLVEISPPCLNTMVSSALEVFPLETYGVVSGDVQEDRVRCTVAQAVQIALRSETSVLPHSAETLRALLQEITRTIGIASFHSHPSSGLPIPSDADVDAFEAAGDVVHFILGISETDESDKDFTCSSFRVANGDDLFEIPAVLVGTVAHKKVIIGCYSISQKGILVLPVEIGSSYSPRICVRCGGILRSDSATCPYCEANIDS